MTSSHSIERPQSIANGARRPTEAEHASMTKIVDRFDEGVSKANIGTIKDCLSHDAIVEIKPAGLRIDTINTIIEMFRRSLAAPTSAISERQRSQIWSNQNGIAREWFYPVRLSSGQLVKTRQLEVIEFDENLTSIKSYRLRMGFLYAKLFDKALGTDFATLPGIKRVIR